jgi:hypothetical protein
MRRWQGLCASGTGVLFAGAVILAPPFRHHGQAGPVPASVNAVSAVAVTTAGRPGAAAAWSGPAAMSEVDRIRGIGDPAERRPAHGLHDRAMRSATEAPRSVNASAIPGTYHPRDGEGLAAFAASGIEQVALSGYCDPPMLMLIALDRRAGSDLRNEALNGLRRFQVPEFEALATAIADSAEFDDDYRAYAAQHLAVWCVAGAGNFAGESWIRHALEPLLEESMPVGVRREAIYGLLCVAGTRSAALNWIDNRIRSGDIDGFGDIYVRVCREQGIVAGPQLMQAIAIGQRRSVVTGR